MKPSFQPIQEDQVVPVIDLWTRAGLVVPRNDPARDIAFARSAPNAEILVAMDSEKAVAAGMVGHDGHRGWVYYIAVDPDRQGASLGRALMHACEAWLTDRGSRKPN